MYKRPVHHRGGVATGKPPAPASGPALAGLKVFLHIRDGPSNAAADASAAVKKQCKKLVQQLGASLTLSEHGADIVIFHYGSEALLKNLLAQGHPVVVQPSYLVACAQAGRRLDTTSYIPTLANTPQHNHRQTKNDMMPTQVQHDTQAACVAPCKNTHVALQDKPYLLDSSSEDDESATTRPVSPPSIAGDEQQKLHVSSHAATSNDDNHGVQLASEDEVRHAILRSAAHRLGAQDATGRTSTDASTIAQQDPFLSRRTATGSGRGRRANPKHHRNGDDSDSVEKDGKTNTISPRHSRPKARKTHSRDGVHNDSSSTQQQQPVLTMAFTDTAQLRALTWPDAPSQVLPAHELYIAIDPTGPSKGFNSRTQSSTLVNYSLLVDVIEQLGAHYVPCEALYGRRRKPTHLIVDAASHGSAAAVLLARALGIRILTPQWLYDAIALGAFPQILPGIHTHPVYRCGADEAPSVHATRPLSSSSSAATVVEATARAELRFLRKGVAEEMLPVGQQWERADYRPLLAEVHLSLSYQEEDEDDNNKEVKKERRRSRQSSSAAVMDVVAAREQVTELVRLLGGMVVRNANSPTVQLILDLSHAMPTQDRMMDPATCLQAAFAIAVRNAAVSEHNIEPVTLAQGTSNDAAAVPVVCLGWLVHCLLARRRLPYADFILNTTSISSAAVVGATPVQTSPHTPLGALALQEVEVNPYSKTRPGPSSAVKEAKYQLDTQQIDAVLREPSSETNDTRSPSSALLPSSTSSTCSTE